MKINSFKFSLSSYGIRASVISILICAFFTTEAQNRRDTISPTQKREQEMRNSVHVIKEGGGEVNIDSLNRLLNMFYVDQFRHFQDPRSPYFMFMSKSGNLAMGVGGVIRVRGSFDWDGSIPSPGFSPYNIPVPKDPLSMRDLQAAAAGTSLFFSLLGHNDVLGDFRGYIEAGFSGYGYKDFKLKKAYITIRDWTAGLATTTFEDSSAEPSTVDGAGANGVNSKTNVLARYMHTFKDNTTIAASFEFPSSSKSADGVHTRALNDYVPDFAAFVQQQWDGGESHVRLSGLLRTLAYRNLVKGKNESVTGWGAQFSTVLKVLPQLKLYGIASCGKGHASYTTDLGNSSFDLIPKTGEEGTLYAPLSTGYVFGATYYFSSKIFATIAGSEQRYYPKHNPDDSVYKYGLYGVANVFWDITPRFELGLEYLAGKRMNFNGQHGNANRLMAMVQLSF